jgi:hypothetical protein
LIRRIKEKMESIIQYFSIAIEALIAIIGILMFFQKKKIYGFGFFITFGIYVFYDLARLLGWDISNNILYISFLIASLSALLVVWAVYKLK